MSTINDIKDTAPLTKAQARVLAEQLFGQPGALFKANCRVEAA